MVHITAEERDQLRLVAESIRDAFEANGFSVDLALGQHDAFRVTIVPASALERGLAVDAAARAAQEAGLHYEGKSYLRIFSTTSGVVRQFALKSVKVDSEGRYVAACNLNSRLLQAEPGDELMPLETWVLGYHVTPNRVVDSVIAAQIVDWEERGNGPVELIFGTVLELLSDEPPRRFVSADEDLEGFEKLGERDGDAELPF